MAGETLSADQCAHAFRPIDSSGQVACIHCNARYQPELIPSKDESLDSTEQYYAHMEADRNKSEASYFDARPLLDREGDAVDTFRAGFERAYQLLWNDLQASRRETASACQETREAIARETIALRRAHETSARQSVTLTGYQLKEALEWIAPDCEIEQLESDVTIEWGDNGHAGAGYYASMTEYPDEGSILLDGKSPEKAEAEPDALRVALEEIQAVASGEREMADAIDDTDGMAWIDKRAQSALNGEAKP